MSHSLIVRREGSRLVLASDAPAELWIADEVLREADPRYMEVTAEFVTFKLDNATLRYQRTGRDAERGIHFARLVEESRWLTVADLKRNQGWSANQIYWYARRDGWRRTSTRPRGYHSEDVTDTIEKESREVPAAM